MSLVAAAAAKTASCPLHVVPVQQLLSHSAVPLHSVSRPLWSRWLLLCSPPTPHVYATAIQPFRLPLHVAIYRLSFFFSCDARARAPGYLWKGARRWELRDVLCSLEGGRRRRGAAEQQAAAAATRCLCEASATGAAAGRRQACMGGGIACGTGVCGTRQIAAGQQPAAASGSACVWQFWQRAAVLQS